MKHLPFTLTVLLLATLPCAAQVSVGYDGFYIGMQRSAAIALIKSARWEYVIADSAQTSNEVFLSKPGDRSKYIMMLYKSDTVQFVSISRSFDSAAAAAAYTNDLIADLTRIYGEPYALKTPPSKFFATFSIANQKLAFPNQTEQQFAVWHVRDLASVHCRGCSPLSIIQVKTATTSYDFTIDASFVNPK